MLADTVPFTKQREREASSNQSSLMETEGSSFETSEVLATFLASTPLLWESWRLCSVANTTPQVGFVTEQIGSTGYLAFSSMEMNQMMSESAICYGNLVPLDNGNYPLFSPLHRQINENEDPISVHAGFLHLFFSIYTSPNFQTQVYDPVEEMHASFIDSVFSIGGTSLFH